MKNAAPRVRRTFLGAVVAIALAPTIPHAQHGGHGGASWPDHREEPARPSPPRRPPDPLPARPAQVFVFIEQGGFWPRDFTVRRNEATEIFVLRRDDTCTTELVIPKLGVRLPVPLGKPVQFRVQVAEADTIPFSCGDGDLGGVITVQ